MMDPVKKTIDTYDKIAYEYCKKTHQIKFLNWEEEYIKKQLDHISEEKPLILDVGCGDGRHCIIIEKLGGKVIGIDLSEGMLEEAKVLHPEGDFRLMDMQHLDFDDDFFNGIWSSGSIYHVLKSSVEEVIREFTRVLKPGGILAINFKLGEGEGMEADPKSYSGSPRYFAYYSKGEMEVLLGKFGFDVLDSCTYPEEVFGDNLQQMWLELRE